MNLSGRSLIGSSASATSGRIFRAVNPTTGEEFDPPFYSATRADVDRAAQLASEAFAHYRRFSGKQRNALIHKIADNMEALGDDLVARAVLETALPTARIQGEVARTCFQLRFYGDAAEEGSWVDARIDTGDPARTPLPKPDMRSLAIPLGPVVVFCASNFPLAYSVAGGDTASALASGNPVIVRAHAAHPGTAEMVGRAIQQAVRECRMPEGVFSLLFDDGIEVGSALIKHPAVKAVGFTGSQAGGRALMDAAASRPEPIPVYAEMGSVNPVFILPGAMKERGSDIAKGLHASVTQGGGQFCTKPGVVIIGSDGPARDFTSQMGELMASKTPFTLLTSRIHASYLAGIAARSGQANVKQLSPVPSASEGRGYQAPTAIFETDAPAFLSDEKMQLEIFGPDTLLVRQSSREQILAIARKLEGHLTASIHGTPEDLREYADLVAILETKVGRIIFNGYPTGLEVCHAVVHGGPYPATSDGRSTSVGTRALQRFGRLVCYQNFPDAALPDELKDANPLGIWRMINGQTSREPVNRRSLGQSN